MSKSLYDTIKASGQTVAGVARAAGIESNNLRAIMRGRRNISLSMRERIAGVLGCSVEEIDWTAAAPSGVQSVGVGRSEIRVLVTGTTGEKDDRMSWPVREFDSREAAEEFIEAAEAWLFERKLAWRQMEIAPWKVRDQIRPSFDPDFVCDYTGTRYDIAVVVEG